MTNSVEIRQAVDELCDRFEVSWRQGSRPELAAFLPAAGALRTAALPELVLLDLDYRLQAGESRTPEDYLTRYPELRGNGDAALRLAALAARHYPAGTADAPGAGPNLASTCAASADHATAPNPGAPVALPEQFGPYRIVRRLGQGGMGTVFLARDTTLDRQVALKVCHIADQPDALKRFHREAKAAAALRHPNLCPVYEFAERDGIAYLTMAFLEGPSLKDWRKTRTLTQWDAARLVAKLALAIHAAHEQGVVHRDLKPTNIVMENDEPVIVDFGLARIREGGTRLTQLGTVAGTPGYMAPEQAAGLTEQAGPGCDIYSLGVILYELLTGTLPFSGPLLEMAMHVQKTPPTPPRQKNPRIDRGLEAICLKALAKKPADRYPAAKGFADALLAAAPRSAPAPPAPPPVLPRISIAALTSAPAAGVTPPAMQQPPAVEAQKPAPSILSSSGRISIAGVASTASVDKRPPPEIPKRGTTLRVVMVLALFITLGLAVWLGMRFWPVAHAPAPHFTNKLGMKFVWIQQGTFAMGSPSSEEDRQPDETLHPVTLTRGFYISATLVTQWQWEEIMGSEDPSTFKGDNAEEKKKLPVSDVSWDDCQAFCKKLSDRDKRTYKLPTEAQWEYACRAGTRTPFWWGDTITTDQANFNGDPYGKTGATGRNRERPTPVDAFKPNPWGLHDMHGNLRQWCEDWYNPYPTADSKDPLSSKASDRGRVLRGGSYRDPPQACRAAARFADALDRHGSNFGCRIVCQE